MATITPPISRPMGIGLLGSSPIIFKSRKFRWKITLQGKYNLKHSFYDYIKVAKRPEVPAPVEETEINFLSDKFWIPGKKAPLKDSEGVIYTDISFGTKIDLMELAAAQQPIDCKIELFDGCGCLLETFVFNEAIMFTAKEDYNLDYSEKTFSIKWLYESCQYIEPDYKKFITI